MAEIEYGKSLDFAITSIEGLVVLDLPVHGDDRGWFKENYQRAKMTNVKLTVSNSEALKDIKIVQNNISYNTNRGVTRGLHAEPWDKFISVATGSVFGAWVDLRAGSATYGKSFTTVIDPSKAIFVPRGVANGYQALKDNTAYTYLVNDHWSPDAGSLYTFVSIFDETLNINWPIPLDSPEVTVSDKDKAHPALKDVVPMLPKKTLIIGANGQLGRAVRNYVTQNVSSEVQKSYIWTDIIADEASDIVKFDFTDVNSYVEFDWSGIGTIINCAAYTNVDGAEYDEGRKLAWKINASAPALLAKYANEYDITLVHISTDYVFDGEITGEHLEAEELSPLGVYGQTKAAGDLAIMGANRHYIVRTSWVIGDGHNFIKIMQSLAEKGVKPNVVNDQIGRLTFAQTLAEGIFHLLTTSADYGVYNLQNSGETVSWADIAALTFEKAGKPANDVTGVSTQEYYASQIAEGKKISPRPANGVLNLDKIIATGFTPSNWRDGFDQI